MIRNSMVFCAVLGLAACGGGGSRYDSGRGYGAVVPVQFASGPIQRACQVSGRREASIVRCGCVQAVADQSLSSSDQRRGARYFKDPHKLQEVRQSSNSGNERFWKVWKEFGQSAEAQCGST